jgi:hypothetical protein
VRKLRLACNENNLFILNKTITHKLGRECLIDIESKARESQIDCNASFFALWILIESSRARRSAECLREWCLTCQAFLSSPNKKPNIAYHYQHGQECQRWYWRVRSRPSILFESPFSLRIQLCASTNFLLHTRVRKLHTNFASRKQCRMLQRTSNSKPDKRAHCTNYVA